jgi:hypothetical protein
LVVVLICFSFVLLRFCAAPRFRDAARFHFRFLEYFAASLLTQQRCFGRSVLPCNMVGRADQDFAAANMGTHFRVGKRSRWLQVVSEAKLL